jgi:hypothetical protein
MNHEDRDQIRDPDRKPQDVANRDPITGEAVNPTVEDEYWRSNWSNRPYTDRSRSYEHYQPAYRLGWESRERFRNRRWEEVELDLASEWHRQRERDRASLKWDEARLAARDAWHRVEGARGGGPSRERR